MKNNIIYVTYGKLLLLQEDIFIKAKELALNALSSLDFNQLRELTVESV
ncbi:hypothetical protein [Paenibacillus melissococcoides]